MSFKSCVCSIEFCRVYLMYVFVYMLSVTMQVGVLCK